LVGGVFAALGVRQLLDNHVERHGAKMLKQRLTKRILVVEDQADNRQIIRDMLAPTDYQITEAENGEQRLQQSQSSGPISS
jgi:PleD family two-component response regulator